MKWNTRSVLKITSASLAALLLLAQFLPYGRDHSNPPVEQEPMWNTSETRRMFMQVCGDCHSHETTWPWYSHVAPFSWWVAHDVQEGRARFNISQWDPEYNAGPVAAELVAEGEMPLTSYRLLHSAARLDKADRDQLIQGLIATFGQRKR